jgi:small subunit ribosomal protein S4
VARNLDAKCRQCRREGEKLFLKGEKCFTDKCAIERRNYAPGQHGQKNTALSGYGVQLREKQKVRRTYGMLERQFRKNYKERPPQGRDRREPAADARKPLDTVAYRMGFGASRTERGRWCAITASWSTASG